VTKETAEKKALEVEAAAEERGALWKRIYAAPVMGIGSGWDVFAETQTGLRYRWNEADNKF
jgi:hypothetical protein